MVALASSAAFLLPGCATASSTPVDHAVFHDLGDLDGEAVGAAVDRLIGGTCGFSLARRSEQFATLYYETGWMVRKPLPQETTAGITAARTRLLIRGQRRGGGRYRTLLEGENEIRTDSLPEWRSAPVTEDFAAWMDRLAAELGILTGAANLPESDRTRLTDGEAPCGPDGVLQPLD